MPKKRVVWESQLKATHIEMSDPPSTKCSETKKRADMDQLRQNRDIFKARIEAAQKDLDAVNAEIDSVENAEIDAMIDNLSTPKLELSLPRIIRHVKAFRTPLLNRVRLLRFLLAKNKEAPLSVTTPLKRAMRSLIRINTCETVEDTQAIAEKLWREGLLFNADSPVDHDMVNLMSKVLSSAISNQLLNRTLKQRGIQKPRTTSAHRSNTGATNSIGSFLLRMLDASNARSL